MQITHSYLQGRSIFLDFSVYYLVINFLCRDRPKTVLNMFTIRCTSHYTGCCFLCCAYVQCCKPKYTVKLRA